VKRNPEKRIDVLKIAAKNKRRGQRVRSKEAVRLTSPTKNQNITGQSTVSWVWLLGKTGTVRLSVQKFGKKEASTLSKQERGIPRQAGVVKMTPQKDKDFLKREGRGRMWVGERDPPREKNGCGRKMEDSLAHRLEKRQSKRKHKKKREKATNTCPCAGGVSGGGNFGGKGDVTPPTAKVDG